MDGRSGPHTVANLDSSYLVSLLRKRVTSLGNVVPETELLITRLSLITWHTLRKSIACQTVKYCFYLIVNIDNCRLLYVQVGNRCDMWYSPSPMWLHVEIEQYFTPQRQRGTHWSHVFSKCLDNHTGKWPAALDNSATIGALPVGSPMSMGESIIYYLSGDPNMQFTMACLKHCFRLTLDGSQFEEMEIDNYNFTLTQSSPRRWMRRLKPSWITHTWL